MPIYQNQQDADNEQQAMRKLQALHGGLLTPTPVTAGWDYTWRLNLVTYLVEVKTRTTPSTKYRTLIIDKAKVDNLCAHAESVHAFPLLVVQWSDRLGAVMVSDAVNRFQARVGGRWDRGDGFDVDTVYHIPVSEFRMVTLQE
jgi:hypothetical protein